ncbi:MAG: hypothetical protein ABIL58_27745 [Pseudomonadota bacterium]
MATQLTSGEWTPIEPLPEALETFQDLLTAGAARRFIVGTEQQIEEEQQTIELKYELEQLKQDVGFIKSKLSCSTIVAPTSEQIRNYGKSLEDMRRNR